MGTVSFDINFWVLLFLVINFIVSLLAFIANRHKAAADDLMLLEKSLDDDIKKVSLELYEQGQRIARIEGDLKRMPDHDDLSVVHEKINKVAETMAGIKAAFDVQSHTLKEINQYLRTPR